MSNDEKLDFEEIHNDFEELSNESASNFANYAKTISVILAIPLLINAGAAVTLAAFFEKGNTPDNIVYAILSFILGAIFGLLTIINEFAISFFTWKMLANFFPALGKNMDIKQVAKKLRDFMSHNRVKRIKKIQNAIVLRNINGAISIICCYMGIYFITSYILKNSCCLIMTAIFILAYAIGSNLWIRSQLKLDLS